MKPEVLIPLMILIPLSGGLALAFVPARDQVVRAWAAGLSLVTLLISLVALSIDAVTKTVLEWIAEL